MWSTPKSRSDGELSFLSTFSVRNWYGPKSVRLRVVDRHGHLCSTSGVFVLGYGIVMVADELDHPTLAGGRRVGVDTGASAS